MLCIPTGLGKDISDGEEDLESKFNILSTPQSNQFGDISFRPKTSPAISHLPIQMRPQTAPESVETSRQTPALPWLPRGSATENISIQEVIFFSIHHLVGVSKSIASDRFLTQKKI